MRKARFVIHGRSAAIGLSLACLPFLIVSSITGSQENAPKQGSQLSVNVEVAVTNVEVIVRDKDGRPITGLKPELFEIYEDGVLQTVTNFFEVKPLLAPASGTGEDLAKRAGSRTDSILPDRLRNKIVFFFDNEHLHPFNRNWVAQRLEKFITRNFDRGEENEGMIVLLDHRMEIIQNFTPRASVLLSALDNVKRRTSGALQRTKSWEELESDLNRIASQTSGLGGNDPFEDSVAYARQYVEEEMNALHLSVQSIESLANYLSGIKGRKIVIYVSDRLPLNPGEEIFSYIGQIFPANNAQMEALNYDASQLFKEVIALCNAKEISLYAIHAAEFEETLSSADLAGARTVNTPGSRLLIPGTTPHNDGLDPISRETGGRPVFARGDLEARPRGSVAGPISILFTGIQVPLSCRQRFSLHQRQDQGRQRRQQNPLPEGVRQELGGGKN